MKSQKGRDAAAVEEAYREVFGLEHTDPLDPLFKFPDWVPDRDRQKAPEMLEEAQGL